MIESLPPGLWAALYSTQRTAYDWHKIHHLRQLRAFNAPGAKGFSPGATAKKKCVALLNFRVVHVQAVGSSTGN